MSNTSKNHNDDNNLLFIEEPASLLSAMATLCNDWFQANEEVKPSLLAQAQADLEAARLEIKYSGNHNSKIYQSHIRVISALECLRRNCEDKIHGNAKHLPTASLTILLDKHKIATSKRESALDKKLTEQLVNF